MSPPPSAQPAADRNLLFGILALQMDFITRDQLVAAMHAWVLDKAKALGQILVEQAALRSDRHALLEALVQEHLKQHDNDPEKSLAAVSSVGSVRQELRQIADPDLQASLVHVSAARDGEDDSYATKAPSVGTLTSTGLRFRILRPHAKGGLGQVSVALDDELHREVALKEIQDKHADHPESRSRFLLEAEITGGLEHPGIVPVYGLGTYADGRPFYAMRFIRGDSLKDAIDKFHKLDVPGRDPGERGLELRELLGRFLDVCNAMQYAHDRGVLHRDLKPGNIMLGKYGETLLVDWGLAKVLNQKQDAATLAEEKPLRPTISGSGSSETQAGTAIGTPAYMSPEQAAGRLELLGPASDVYSLGATLYCLLTGKPPIESADVGEMLGKVQRGDFPKPRKIKPAIALALEAICLKAMALQASERYAAPRELGADIEHWLADEPVGAWPEPWRVRAGRWLRRHQALASALAVAFLMVLISSAVAAFWYQGYQAEMDRIEAETARDKAETARQQQAERVRQIENDLSRAALARQEKKWPDAWKAVERAEERLAAGGSEELRERVRQARAELEQVRKDQIMVARLIEARLKVSGINFYVAKSGNAADTAFREAFAEYGLDVENLTPELAGEKIRQSAIREELVCALYEWSAATTIEVGKISPRAWRLLHLAEKNDPDPWRKQFVEPVEQKDWATVLRLAEQTDPAQLSPSTAWQVGTCVRLAGRGEKAVALLQEVHRRHPDDFQLNVELARSYLYLAKPSRPDEAARYYTAASVLRPANAQVYAELGNALRYQNKLPEAIAACHEAIRIDPDCSSAFFYLGLALLSQGKPGEAEVAFRKQLSFPFESDSAMGHNNLGAALMNQGKLADAAAEFNESIRLDAEHALPHYSLGWVLRQQGKFADSLASYLRAQELGPRTRWNTTPAQTAQAVRDAKRLVELEAKLPGLRKGETKPADAHEQIELGRLCRYLRRYAESVAFYQAGFRAKPALATDLAAAHRYNAASSAAQAGTGQGEEATTLTETERDTLRKDALDWLRADLVLRQKQAESDKPQDRAAVVRAMQHWRRDTDLAAVRDAIDQLPEAERDDWRKLWQDVESLLQRADVPK